MSALELHPITARMTAGLLNTAQRGARALTWPVGCVRDALGTGHPAPQRAGQSRLRLLVETCLRLRAASQVWRAFHRDNWRRPRRDRCGDVGWRKPTVSAMLSRVHHPASAGALSYGRPRTIRTGPGPPPARPPLLSEEWHICLQDTYPASIRGDTYAPRLARRKEHYAQYDRQHTRGGPRPGKALLHGSVYCGACGPKMVVQYKTGTRSLGNSLRQQYGGPVCQYMPAAPIEAAVVEAFCQALSPGALDAYHQAREAKRPRDAALELAPRQQLQRLPYPADLAERQVNPVDPAHRCVAAELERRWDNAWRARSTAQEPYDNARRHTSAAPPLSAALSSACAARGQQLPEIWTPDLVAPAQKKALLRCLMETGVLHRRPRDTVATRIVGPGGEGTARARPMAVGSWRERRHSAELEQPSVEMPPQGLDEATIAQRLTAQGDRAPLPPTQ